jgi:2-oxoglutarate dehydrogenase E2 component (dihydrolipoamide succinyltransferase)
METNVIQDFKSSSKFLSPLVKNIAREENISVAELETIAGSGAEGRVTKKDILDFVQHRKPGSTVQVAQPAKVTAAPVSSTVGASAYAGDEIIEMDRMRKMIAERMVDSKRIAPHVTSFVEADVTNIVFWRNKVKNEFQKREGDALTFTPIFVEAVALAIKDFPMVNIQVDGDKIIKKKDINIGIAVALPSGNLIVPVIRNADQYNLSGLAKAVNDLVKRARNNKLKADDLAGGTFTISNVGTFGNVMGTPIIMQPQVGIIAIGAIQKKPAVVETPYGDAIAIRHKMFLSHSYDHRVVDGALGGSLVRRVADFLEKFDVSRGI